MGRDTNQDADATLEEIYELTGADSQIMALQHKWAYDHRKQKDLMKTAAQEWGRNTKNMAKAWGRFTEEFVRDLTRHEQMSLDLIASVSDEHMRIYFYEEWKSKTLSFEQVSERVKALKQRKPKADKETPHQLAERIAEDLFTNGDGEKANRLVMETASPLKGSGWSKAAVIDRIAEALK